MNSSGNAIRPPLQTFPSTLLTAVLFAVLAHVNAHLQRGEERDGRLAISS